MMKNPMPQEEKLIKDTRNVFRLKKEVKKIKDIVLGNIKEFFEYEKVEKYYYKPIKVNTSWSNNYIEYKINGDKNRILSVKEYLNKTIPYLTDIINDLKKSDTQKIQITIIINFISSEDDNDKERLMHPKSDQ